MVILHDDRIKERFGDNRWFVCYGQFPASCTHFLYQLSKVVYPGNEDPQSLGPLWSFLSKNDPLVPLISIHVRIPLHSLHSSISTLPGEGNIERSFEHHKGGVLGINVSSFYEHIHQFYVAISE